MTKALVTGVTGQDGHYLAEHLHALGVEVWGTARSGPDGERLPSSVRLAPRADLRDAGGLRRVLAAVRPDEVYHLGAATSVAASWDDPTGVGDVTGLGSVRLLDAVREIVPEARVFLASSSEVFGEPDRAPQDEETPIRPVTPYGAAKAYAHHMGRIFRRRYGLYVAIGILYNHESPRRPATFVTNKIVRAAVAIARGEAAELRLGNLDARRDWGHAADVVRAMRLALAADAPDDYVIATGEAHTVREWCELAFAEVGLDYREHVTVDQAFWRPTEPVPLVGNPAKAARALGWRPQTGFPELVRSMVRAERGRVDNQAPEPGDA